MEKIRVNKSDIYIWYPLTNCLWLLSLISYKYSNIYIYIIKPTTSHLWNLTTWWHLLLPTYEYVSVWNCFCKYWKRCSTLINPQRGRRQEIWEQFSFMFNESFQGDKCWWDWITNLNTISVDTLPPPECNRLGENKIKVN